MWNLHPSLRDYNIVVNVSSRTKGGKDSEVEEDAENMSEAPSVADYGAGLQTAELCFSYEEETKSMF